MAVAYDYWCNKHGEFEWLKPSIHDETPKDIPCPECGEPAKQLFGMPAIEKGWMPAKNNR